MLAAELIIDADFAFITPISTPYAAFIADDIADITPHYAIDAIELFAFSLRHADAAMPLLHFDYAAIAADDMVCAISFSLPPAAAIRRLR
jgi:hypothetical protein